MNEQGRAFDDITLFSPAQVSDITNIPVATLKKWRLERTNLPYVHMGRSVYYRLKDIRGYIVEHTVRAGGVD